MSPRSQALRQALTAPSCSTDTAETLARPKEPWEAEMAELMGRLSPDNREALLRIARAMADAPAARAGPP